jgi:predicted nicotinamide N-methyase
MHLEQFLELFKALPGNHYLQVTTQPDATTEALSKLMQEVDGELRLAIYGETAFSLNGALSQAKVQLIESFNTPFRALPRDNDMVIFKDIFTQHTNPELLLRIAYTTLANTADVIIMEKKGRLHIEKTKALLEKFEFRAPNSIDIFPEYDLIMAKKMHMWGNGL